MSKMLLARSRMLLVHVWASRVYHNWWGRSCRVCGCTNADCSGCIARTGSPCSWAEPDLCSACVVEPNNTSPNPAWEARFAAYRGRADDLADARRYRYLRTRNLGGIVAGEVFALMAPQRVGLSGPEVDAVIDLHIATEAASVVRAPDYDTAMDAATWGNKPEAEADLQRLQDAGHACNCQCLHCVTARGGAKL